jgi:hypothetical protein
VGAMNMLLWTSEREWDGMGWIDLAQNKDRWRAAFHNFRAAYKVVMLLYSRAICGFTSTGCHGDIG